MASNSSKSSLGVVSKKIDSPLAKYNVSGQLTCLVCNVVVKSDKVWTAHVSGRQHREQIDALKKPKVAEHFVKPLAVKRKAIEPESSKSLNSASPSPSKKGVPSDFFDNKSSNNGQPKPIKSILKNSLKPTVQAVATGQELATDVQMDVDESYEVPVQISQSVLSDIKSGSLTSLAVDQLNHIPEGFFDDPKLDAKVMFCFIDIV